MAYIEKSYREYFNINPDYFPQVNEAIIQSKPDYWKLYYPHETFVKLLNDTVKILSRREKLSIWVEGAYGTGKSHAVLTLKKIIDASEEDTKSYFEKFNLSQDLLNSLQSQKNQGKIITVHRYGSSSIRNDHQLVFAIQESIENSLKEAGIQNKGANSLSKSVIKWLEEEDNKNYFNSLIKNQYATLFSGDDVNTIIEKLKNLTGEALLSLMDKIFKVADEKGIKVLSLDAKGLSDWIKDVIKVNNLKAIVFIWDEFTEFFYNNTRDLTGFQEIVEISATDPFYLIIVTHKSAGLFSDADKDKKKILDRFVKPTCNIELPENMAIRLMGIALEKSNDPTVIKDWDSIAYDLYDRTKDSRKIVKDTARIDDTELKNILPIHPYTALLLKQISSAFQSNQRSMFDFIKNDQGDEAKGFQWFIDNNGPFDDNPLLTIDLLWDFFYEKGKENLSSDIKSILDTYSRVTTKHLNEEQKRVLKTILLMEAISKKVGDSVELFIPDVKNINNAFEGSDLEGGRASNCADTLVKEQILFKKPLGGNKFHYSALINSGDTGEIEKKKAQLLKETTTSSLIQNGTLMENIQLLPGALRLRFDLKPITTNDFDEVIRHTKMQQSNSNTNQIIAFVGFAKDDEDATLLGKKIRNEIEILNDDTFIFIDTSVTPLGQDGLSQYVEGMANSYYQRGKDNQIATQYENNAKDVLKKWRSRIEKGEFIISTIKNKEGERVLTLDNLYNSLRDINRANYPYSLEAFYKVADTFYQSNSFKQGVECAVKKEPTGLFKQSNQAYKIENVLAGAWNNDNYWNDEPSLLVSKIKRVIEEKIQEQFENNGRISIKDIYEPLQEKPYGLRPCNFTAFILGFVLKDYVNGSYTWSDDFQNERFTLDKLKEMIDEVLKLQMTPNPRYRDKYIVTMTEDEKKFHELTSEAFEIPLTSCTSIEQTRLLIRNKLKDFVFPIWTLEYVDFAFTPKTSKELIIELIDCYVGIANNNHYSGNSSDTDIAYKIGKLYIEHPALKDDFKELLTKDNCKQGMTNYLNEYKAGELINLSYIVKDGGQYINVLRGKFTADAANWVWSKDTINSIIDEVILEYKIIDASNKCITEESSFEGVIKNWCEICDRIKVSYEFGKTKFGTIGTFLECLYNIKRANTIQDKQKFYDLLITYSDEFKEFYSNQIVIFSTVCDFYLSDLTQEQRLTILNKLPGSFLKDKSEYTTLIDTTVKEYKNSLGYIKLKTFWKEKTGTESPAIWSKQNRMSILCMIPENEIQQARDSFDTLNKNHPDESSIKRATEYLTNAKFYDDIKNNSKCDKAFEKYILKQYASILKDIDFVKEYLKKTLSCDEYEWYGLPEIDSKIYALAQSEYDKNACNIALEKIDKLEVSELKHYLKTLIKDNMNVGIEIIKG